MLYDVGALPTPRLSRPNYGLRRDLAGLSGPVDALEDLFGLRSVSDILTVSASDMQSITAKLADAQIKTQIASDTAKSYVSSSNSVVAQKAGACVAQANGITLAYSTLKNQATTLINTLSNMSANSSTTKDQAYAFQPQIDSFESQVDYFIKTVSALTDNVSDLVKYATKGPSSLESLENTAGKSISVLTWIAGGSLAVYFLAPTFIPRLIKGVRSARK